MTRDIAELSAWLQLSLSTGVGPSRLRRLLLDFGSPENALEAARAQLARYLPAEALESLYSDQVARAVDQALAWAQAPGHSIVTLADPGYPKLLLEIADPPALLYARGRVELLERPALAMVGSRNATAQGLRNAEQFARAFGAAGLTIVSGLAQGIDSAAHRGGLAAAGSTIAVLGTGIDRIYPPQNRELAQEIAARGLLLSELPLSTPSLRQNFPRRNRLISGLSRGCLVVEAALASGSLITARAAVEQGREVFAVPGSIHSPLARGCHALIKSGAKLVETAEDVLAELPAYRPDPSTAGASRPGAGDTPREPESPLLAHLGYDPVAIDVLCARSGLPAERVAAELLRLELDGRVAPLAGGLYQRQG
jgi:DNA processing protein